MAKNYFKRYIWLIEILQSYGKMTLEEIRVAWMRSYVNDEHKELADRTFFNNIEAIRDMFGIDIVCDRSTNQYYIDNSEDLKGSGIRNWMMNALSLNNLMTEYAALKDRILFEDVPSSQHYLTPIMKAMKEGKKVHVRYQSFKDDEPKERDLNPYCIKSYKQRWYLLATYDDKQEPHIYALDRILELKPTTIESEVPAHFDAQAYFSNYCGYPTGSETQDHPVIVRLKVNAHQSKYFRTLPLHHSQTEVESNDTYSVFEYFLIPNYHFKQQVFSYMDAVQVLEPESLREDMKQMLTSTMRNYRKEESTHSLE